MTANLPIIPGTLPSGYCFESWQQVLRDFTKYMQVQFSSSSFTTIVVSATTPAATDQDKIWYSTTTGRMLQWNAGQSSWTAPHAYPADGPTRIFWTGSLSDLLTFDGGNANPEGTADGPMWEEDTAMRARTALGVGTLTGSGTAVAVNATGGADQVTIAKVNLPAEPLRGKTPFLGHSSVGSSPPIADYAEGSVSESGSGRAVDSTSSDFTGRAWPKFATENMGSATALNVMNPYYVGYWIKRTGRIYYTS